MSKGASPLSVAAIDWGRYLKPNPGSCGAEYAGLVAAAASRGAATGCSESLLAAVFKFSGAGASCAGCATRSLSPCVFGRNDGNAAPGGSPTTGTEPGLTGMV